MSLPESYSISTDEVFTPRKYQWSFDSCLGSPALVEPFDKSKPTPYIGETKPMAALEAPVTASQFTRKINLHLLQSCALLANNEPEEALKEASYSYHLAEIRNVCHLESKSQYYRGLCLMALEEWKDASAAFTKAASIRWWASRVAILKAEAERRILETEEHGRSTTRKGFSEALKYL